MVQITATIDDDSVKKIDHIASQNAISRSKWVALAIQFYLQYTIPRDTLSSSMKVDGIPVTVNDATYTIGDPKTQKLHDSAIGDVSHFQEEINQLNHELSGKNQIIKLQADEIGWLRGECSKLTDRFTLALPAPKKEWWKFWKKNIQ